MLINRILVKENKAVAAELTVVCLKEKNQELFIYQIPALNLSSHGSTAENARKGLTDAVALFFKVWKNYEKLTYKLTKLGWNHTDHRYENNDVQVPLGFLAAQHKTTSQKFALV